MITRILDLIDASGLSDSAMCKELELGNGIIGKWRKGIQKPSTDAIIKVASYFNVSTDYLLLGTNRVSTSFSVEDAEWLSLIHQLPKNAKLEFKGELKGYIKALNHSCNDLEGLKEAK
ncbi:helix-turn-helix domain-containing protein [Mediterraneibacter agrestimuris]|uniref:helix-turn-helix domain-containing protein n=1 Tax=Mediterraneibacter agrestimuris TaxID=2941333 RepID=UPI00203F07A5|nr:helix-turn-helix transcriptional regulator [Mediterraneibacter agrestimuris]